MNKEILQTFIQVARELMVARKVVPVKITPPPFTTDDVVWEVFLEKGLYNQSDVESYIVNKATGKKYSVQWKDVIVPLNPALIPLNPALIPFVLANIVTRIEDSIVFTKLYNSAGNCYSTPNDFLTCGNAIKTTEDSIKLLDADGYNGRLGTELTLNSIQYYEVLKSFGYIQEYPQVLQLLHGGNIHLTELEKGTGLLFPSPKHNDNFFNYRINLDWQVFDFGEGKYRVYASIEEPVVNEPNMLCKLTAI